MGNFKIKIKTNGNNASEVIDMLILIGKKPITTKEGLLSEIAMGTNMIVDTGNGLFTTCGDYDVEELTLPELRDMVVLKRNDVNDATHENSILKYFKACDDWYYFDLGCTDKWQKSAGAKPEYYEKLKPIEKNMKEYLDKQEDGTYKLIKADGGCVDRDWIEVPEGAIRARFYPHDPDELEFENAFYQWWHGENKDWSYYADYGGSVQYSCVVWQRTPSLNDQYAEIEQVRQASKDNVNNPQHYNKGGVECIDAIEASMTPEAFKGYLKGNVQKYMWRYEQKGGVESLRKAQWYLERLVASMDS